MAYYRVGDTVLSEEEYAEHNSTIGEWMFAALLVVLAAAAGEWCAKSAVQSDVGIPIGGAIGLVVSMVFLGRFRRSLVGLIVSLLILACVIGAGLGAVALLGHVSQP